VEGISLSFPVFLFLTYTRPLLHTVVKTFFNLESLALAVRALSLSHARAHTHTHINTRANANIYTRSCACTHFHAHVHTQYIVWGYGRCDCKTPPTTKHYGLPFSTLSAIVLGKSLCVCKFMCVCVCACVCVCVYVYVYCKALRGAQQQIHTRRLNYRGQHGEIVQDTVPRCVSMRQLMRVMNRTNHIIRTRSASMLPHSLSTRIHTHTHTPKSFSFILSLKIGRYLPTRGGKACWGP